MGRSTRLLIVMLGAVVTVWAATDPAVGTWTLNLAKSKYIPGPPPKSQTRIYQEDAGGGIKATVKTVNPDGTSVVVIYPSNWDGKEYPVSGSPDTDGIIMKKVDDRTSESLLKHAGAVIGVARRTISQDGKTMTIIYKGVVQGETVNNVAVYEKEP